MAVLVTAPWVEERLMAEREASGADRFDEVWNGVYFMTPLANGEHQDLVMGFGFVYQEVIGLPGLGEVRPGVNVSDRVKGWKKNYRIPDVAIFLKGGKAHNCGTHWCGGPNFATEIIRSCGQNLGNLVKLRLAAPQPFAKEGPGMRDRHALSDASWERIQDLLPGKPGVTAMDHRLFSDAVR